MKEDSRRLTANEGVLEEDEEDSSFSSGSEDDELESETGPSSDSQVEAASFMFGLPEELVRNQILLRAYVARDGRTTSVSALHMLCVLHLVCKYWKTWIDSSPDWIAARNLFPEDAIVFNNELWAELGDTEDEEEGLSFLDLVYQETG